MTKEIASLASTLPSVPMAVAIAIIQDVATGLTVSKACKNRRMLVPSFRALLKKEPELQAMLDEALKARDDALNDMLINIDEHHSEAKMAAVVSKNIQWVLERSDPTRFAARLTLQSDNEVSRNLAEALNKAMERIPALPQSRPAITDVTFEMVPDKVAAPLGAAPLQVREEQTVASTPQDAAMEELRRLGLI